MHERKFREFVALLFCLVIHGLRLIKILIF